MATVDGLKLVAEKIIISCKNIQVVFIFRWKKELMWDHSILACYSSPSTGVATRIAGWQLHSHIVTFIAPPNPPAPIKDSWFGHQLSWATSTAVSLNLQSPQLHTTHSEQGKGDSKLGQSSLAPLPSNQRRREKTLVLGRERIREDTVGSVLQSLKEKKNPGTQSSVSKLQNIQFYRFFYSIRRRVFIEPRSHYLETCTSVQR